MPLVIINGEDARGCQAVNKDSASLVSAKENQLVEAVNKAVVASEVADSQTPFQKLQEYAREYEEVRASMPPSPPRTLAASPVRPWLHFLAERSYLDRQRDQIIDQALKAVGDD